MKKKVLLVLMTVLLPFAKGQAQDSFTCVHDLLQVQDTRHQRTLGDISKTINYGTKRWRERNPNMVFYPKPQPAPYCDICMTIDPNCFKSRYALPVIVHIVAKTGDTIPDVGSNIPDAQVHNAIADLNKKFAGFGQTDPRTANTGIQFYLAPVGPDSNGILLYNSV